MNRNHIKIIAVLAMTTDHIGMLFLSVDTAAGFLCRFAGRLTAPVMCYFLAEGFRCTRSRKAYSARLLTFAVIAQPVYAAAHENPLWTADFNMLFTLFFALCILTAYAEMEKLWIRTAMTAGCLALSLFSDWGIAAPLWTLLFYRFQGKPRKQLFAFSLVAAYTVIVATAIAIWNNVPWQSQLFRLGIFLFIPLFYLYNGNPGKTYGWGKWFFYAYYPLHLFALVILYRNMS